MYVGLGDLILMHLLLTYSCGFVAHLFRSSMSIYLSIYLSIYSNLFIYLYRVLTQWHSSKAGEDFLSWDPQMFSDFREEYGNCDVLICESNICSLNILGTIATNL